MPTRDITGHRHARLLLQGALRSGRISHAYLFVGPSGVGRLTTARAFAQALLCSTGGEDACGVCAACRKVDRKSTRLNSSHLVISYAVFCLKKKNSEHKTLTLHLAF